MAHLLIPWFLLFSLVSARCGCGYSVIDPRDKSNKYLFTDLLESDFTRGHDISQDAHWVRQQFNVSAEAGRGDYGKVFELDNVRDGSALTLHQVVGHDAAGLELLVSSAFDKDSVPAAELDTARLDLHWGSYRAGLKLTDVNGTCAAFFWYFNDTQEIDVEFLSREFDREKKIYPVNLVIQSRESMAAGYDAQRTGTYKRLNLLFDPTAGFHEYRFDYLPGRVAFYADSEYLAEMKGVEVPSSGGHLILQHWSNGNPQWSGGPPDRDAVLTVSYVKAYFNSSDASRHPDWGRSCSGGTSDGADVCVVPDVDAANASTGGAFLDRDGQDKQGPSHGESGADDDNDNEEGRGDVGSGGGEREGGGESNVASRLLSEVMVVAASLPIVLWLVALLVLPTLAPSGQ